MPEYAISDSQHSAEAADTPLPSEVGAYRVDGRLGAGGMGEVYRGWDAKLDRPVALKRIAPDAADAEVSRDMFRREARAVARLHHGSIVQVFELIEGEDGDWLVMELVDGKSLRELCGGKKTRPSRVIEIGRGICTGLTAAHEAGIAHRDLKLDNVMLTATGEVKILDFGVYKRLAPEDGVSLTQTLSVDGRLVGTVTAMSPEQAAGEEIDHRSDLFSLGSLLYELLTGTPPFIGKTSHETLSRICLRKETPAEELVPEVPESLSLLIGLLLEKEPAKRPQSAEKVQLALAEIAAEMSGVMPRLDPATWTGEFAPYKPGAEAADTPPSTVSGTLPTAVTTPSGPTVRTLLLNDLVDSTQLVEELGDERAAEIFEQHDRKARELLKATGGREIDKSDGFLMLFERPMDAVRFALGYHAALEEISEREGVPVSSRVGIHVGEVVLRVSSAEDVARGAKPLEVEGLAKAMAARFMTLAGARQTLISRGVYDLGKRAAVGAADLPEGLQWMAQGRYTMKGLAEPVRVYEVGVAGVAPFTAPADTKKVKRVKEVSGQLSGWRLKAAVAAMLVTVALAATGARQLWVMREVPPPLYVAVPPTEVVADSDLRLAASVIQAGLIRAIQGYVGVAPVEPTGRHTEVAEPQILALAMGADEVLLSKLECSGSTCQVVLKRVLGSDNRVVWNHRFIDRTRNLLDLTHLAVEQVRAGYLDFDMREGVSELHVEPEDYEEFWHINRRFLNREPGSDLDAILADLRRLQETSPRFPNAYRLEGDILRMRFMTTRAAADLEAAISVFGQAVEQGLKQPRVLRSFARALIEAGRLDDAETAIQEIARIEPGDAELYGLRAALLERRGEPAEALALMRQSVERMRSADQLTNLADMEYRMGEVDNARAHLEAALEADPGNFETETRLALIELVDGSVERAAELYEGLVERMPEYAELTNLGVAYLLLQRYADAVEIFERALEGAPGSPQNLLNLADARLLSGETQAAMGLYEKAAEAITQDPDPDALLTAKGQALAHLGRQEEAIAAVQSALRLQPDNPQVVYESALVYMLVGEKTSALLHARHALELGLEIRWFEFAWFDPIRDELEGAQP